MAEDGNSAEADILIVEKTEPGSLTSADVNGGRCKIVYVANKSDESLGQNIIRRPLIATRVLSVLDKAAAEIVSSPQGQVGVTEVATEADFQDDQIHSEKDLSSEATTPVDSKNEGAGSIEFSISEEEACELAIVHDEALSNPANSETEKLDATAARENSSTTPILKSTTVTAFPGSGIVRAQQQSIAEEDSQSEIYEIAKPRALVVDDSASVRKQLELELKLFNVTVDYAEDGESAMQLKSERNYNLAFLDVVLPDIDGFQICKHIKSETPDMKVIMLTGKATQADKIKGKLAGCDDYLVKPVGRNTFQATVNNYLDQLTAAENLEAKSF